MSWTGRFRRLAFRALDAIFIFGPSAGLRRSAVILHGASCSGKSAILRRLKRRYTDCVYLETDQLHYWEIEAEPGILNVALGLLMHANVEAKKSTELVGSIEQSRRTPQKPSRHGPMVELLKACLGRDAVIATCGNLPPPYADNGFYRLLGQCTNKTMLHVLVAPDNAVLSRRILARGLEAQLERIIASNNWRLRNRASYDLVLTGNEPTAGIMERIRLSIAKRERPVGEDDCPDRPTEN